MLPGKVHSDIRSLLAACPDVEFARFEADRIVEHLFGLPVSQFWTAESLPPAPGCEEELSRIIEGRKEGVPLAYLLGYVHFSGVRIDVSPGVLIPRQETEGLALIAREILAGERPEREDGDEELFVLDFGCGSGCIAVYLALEFPFSLVWATDISVAAIKATRANIKRYGLGLRVVPIRHDGLAGLTIPGDLHLIVSNPPYIAPDDARLDASVRLHEPHEALIAEGDGLHFFRHIARFGPAMLRAGGAIAVEVGEGQADDVRRIFWASGAEVVEVRKDIPGIDRYVIASYSSPDES